MKALSIALVFILSSCANYVNGIHRQIDREEGVTDTKSKYQNDPYAPYRGGGEGGFKKVKPDARPINNPASFSQLVTSQGEDVNPPVKRDYRPANQRANSRDFVDNGNNGSLWVNNTNPSLFTAEISKKVGDIVIINVYENLRNQISNELKRTFPEEKKKEAAAAAPGKGPAAPATPAPAAGPVVDELDTKVYDKVSGIVSEEISKDYLLVKGKKEVIFRKEKRFIEVQALVSRKDITDNDSVNSDKILESRVLILR